MFSRILVATDFSEGSDRALERAARLALERKATVSVCHVIANVQPINMLFPQATGRNMLDVADLERRVGEALDERVEKFFPGSHVERFVEFGTDYAAIASRAEAWKADLVVVGAHGHTALRRALLGSVSEKILRHAPTSVLVIRGAEGHGPVVAATDLSDPSLPSLRAAASEAAQRKTESVAIHAIDLLPSTAGHVLGTPLGIYGIGLDEATAESVSRGAATVLENAARASGVTRSEIVRGPAVAAIVQRTEELDAQLLVLATHGRTGLNRVLLGSVAEGIVRHAKGSTLVVRHV